MTNKIVHHMSIPYLFKQLLQHELLSTPFYHVLDYFGFYKFSSIKNETPVNIIVHKYLSAIQIMSSE